MTQLLYSNKSSDTGKNIAKELEIASGKVMINRPEKVIRWGNSKGLGYIPDLVVNKQKAVLRAVNKNTSLDILEQNGIPIPGFTTEIPCIGRTINHTGGSGLWFCYLPEHVQSARDDGANYFIKYIPFKKEWRVHVLGDKVPFIQNKYRTRTSTAWGGNQLNWIKKKRDVSTMNSRAIDIAINSFKVLGLDFGAVDIIQDFHNNFYVLEVNTGPALESKEMRKEYVEFFKEILEVEDD